MLPRFFLALALLFAPAAVHAQTTDAQVWLTQTASQLIGDRAKATLEILNRFSDISGGLYDTNEGGWISLQTSKAVEIALGYRHVQSFDHGHPTTNEERPRQQITIQAGKGFTFRFRTEERFRSDGGDVGARFRGYVRFAQPIAHSRIALYVYHESFVNFNTTDWGQIAGLERMRNSAGFTFPIAKKLKGDLGYVNQYMFGRNGARDRMDDVASFSLALTL